MITNIDKLTDAALIALHDTGRIYPDVTYAFAYRPFDRIYRYGDREIVVAFNDHDDVWTTDVRAIDAPVYPDCVW